MGAQPTEKLAVAGIIGAVFVELIPGKFGVLPQMVFRGQKGELTDITPPILLVVDGREISDVLRAT